jgi:hypothetical protein
MHCQQGEKFEHDLACCMYLEGFQVVSSYFWARAVSQVASTWPVRYSGLTGVVPRCWAILSTCLTGEVDRSERSEQGWSSCSVCKVVCMHSSRESCIGSGELAYVLGELFVVFELWIGGLHSLLKHSFVSNVSSRCPCLWGPRLVFLEWSCSLSFLGFRSLVGVSFIHFFSFFWAPCVARGPVDGHFLVWWVIDNVVWMKDRYGEPERGEWMGADKNSSRMRCRLQQDEHNF